MNVLNLNSRRKTILHRGGIEFIYIIVDKLRYVKLTFTKTYGIYYCIIIIFYCIPYIIVSR